MLPSGVSTTKQAVSRITAEVIYPFGLASLLDQLRTAGVPEQPARLPWHH